MNKERLLLLAAKLDEVHKATPDRFNYRTWVGSDWKGNADLSCGTSACALGWATTIPEFQVLGFHLNLAPFAEPIMGTLKTFVAGSKLFDIPYDHSHYLFMPKSDEENMSGEQVATKIREYVTTDGRSAPTEEVDNDFC